MDTRLGRSHDEPIPPFYWWIPGEFSDDLGGFASLDSWRIYMEGGEGPFARFLLPSGTVLTNEGRRIRQIEDGRARAARLRRRVMVEDSPPMVNLKKMDLRLMKLLFPLEWPPRAQPRGLI